MDDITHLKRIKEAIKQSGAAYKTWNDFKITLRDDHQTFIYEHSSLETSLSITWRNRKYYVKVANTKKNLKKKRV